MIAEPHPDGNPALAAATEAILRRRLAATHGDGDEHGRRAAILLDALPDAAAALEAAEPLIRASERERITRWLSEQGADLQRRGRTADPRGPAARRVSRNQERLAASLFDAAAHLSACGVLTGEDGS